MFGRVCLRDSLWTRRELIFLMYAPLCKTMERLNG
jgi:hypothetical protein